MTNSSRRRRDIKTQKCASTGAADMEVPPAVAMMPTDSLEPTKRNARTHNAAQIDQLARSIREFGVIKPVIVDDANRLVAGHGIWAAAKQLGLERIPVIRVSHLSPTQLRVYALADNQLATKSGWDRELLAIELGELQSQLPEIGLDLSITGFDPGDIDSVLADFEDEPASPLDDVPDLQEGPAVCRSGDIYVLGRHRLLVGDARDAAAYAQLMQGEVAEMGIHDVPYNVRIQGNVGGRGRPPQAGRRSKQGTWFHLRRICDVAPHTGARIETSAPPPTGLKLSSLVTQERGSKRADAHRTVIGECVPDAGAPIETGRSAKGETCT